MAGAPLVLTMGDPAGCGPQITSAAWQHFRSDPEICFAIVADPDLISNFCPVEIISQLDTAHRIFASALPVLPLAKALPLRPHPGNPDPQFAPAILESIETATALTLAGQASALITNPIAKSILYKAGFKHPGHTEYLADLCASSMPAPAKPVMMLVGGGLRVALATIHQPLSSVPSTLTIEGLIKIARITAKALRRDFGLKAPKLSFSGLNPHAGEDGTIGKEEEEIINPAAAQLRQEGIDISDARPGDTVFHEALSGQYDAVIAMTHDQGLIPVKTLDFWGGVNTTLGLPILRTSPDHGTAFEAASKGTCRADSLISAIGLAAQMVKHRARIDA